MKKPTTIAGRYVITDEISKGGFGVIYKGYDPTFRKRPIAIKQIHSHLLGEPAHYLSIYFFAVYFSLSSSVFFSTLSM